MPYSTSAPLRRRLARVHDLRRQRYTRAEIAKTIGVSERTISRDFRRLDTLSSDPAAQAQTAAFRLIDALTAFSAPDSFDSLLAALSDPLTLDRPLHLPWLLAASLLDSDPCPFPVHRLSDPVRSLSSSALA